MKEEWVLRLRQMATKRELTKSAYEKPKDGQWLQFSVVQSG